MRKPRACIDHADPIDDDRLHRLDPEPCGTTSFGTSSTLCAAGAETRDAKSDYNIPLTKLSAKSQKCSLRSSEPSETSCTRPLQLKLTDGRPGCPLFPQLSIFDSRCGGRT